MKGVVFVGDGEVEVRNFDVPVPGQGEVLVEMKASGLCGSDLPWLKKTQKELSALPRMNPMGHEPCGVIAALGPNATGVEIGQRIIVYHYKGCGKCKYCRIGYEQYCVHGHRYYGQSTAKGLGGGHEDFMVVQDRVCINLPDEYQSPIITAFYSPETERYDFIKFYGKMKEKGFVIYPGKVTQIDSFRIGNIGHVFPGDIKRLLTALEKSMFWNE